MQLRHSGIPVVVQQLLEAHEHIVVQFLACDELALVETHAVVEQNLDVGDDQRLGELVDRVLEFAGYLAHVVLYDQPLVDREVQGFIGCIGEEGVLPYLLGKRRAVQEIRVEQQGVGFGHGAALDALDADSLPGSEAYHGLVVVVVFGLSIIDGAAHGLLQEEGVEAECHPVCGFGRLAFRTVEMYDADQRMLGAESEKPVILFDGVRLDDFHVRFVCPKITLFLGKHQKKTGQKRSRGTFFRKIDTNSADISMVYPPGRPYLCDKIPRQSSTSIIYHMTVSEFKDYVKTGRALDTEDIHIFMDEMSDDARRITFRLNSAYHTQEKVRALLSELFGYDVPSSLRVFPPFYTDFGKNISVGENVFINACCHFQDHGSVILGDGCQIGHNVVFATLNHGLSPEDRKHTYPAPIVLGKNVWVGSNSTILQGVAIGDNAVVAAGAVVTKNVPANVVVGGVPARIIKEITADGSIPTE